MVFSRRRVLRHAFAAGLATLATAVHASKPPVFANDGTAINGYDPVAYFTQSAPVKGNRDISYDWHGSAWLFATEQNKSMFIENPEKYAPQYGGYCAYAVANGATAKTDPDAWTIVDDKLYLNFNTDVRATWQQDTAGNISRANANWPDVLK
ncbi:hypothetical protein GCM10008927_20720 [Amylibacter ulvae]|uniref:YHS domain-containing protein n=1 Tax=Paramylibacter ulvae TaxID=1651968 RepID=A0ABQ3D437_9RHOB|nr:YHS domain-containing (seleno)protein [Amylibacter ulvae]GHA54769.1 hypothetical protein GCM10008927_20720 [Amylibacter ulvae]